MPDTLSLGNFLNSDEQKVLQLRIVDMDAWTGLMKVYQVLGKNDCLSEGHLYHTGFRALVTCQSAGEYEYTTAVDNSTTSVNDVMRHQSTA